MKGQARFAAFVVAVALVVVFTSPARATSQKTFNLNYADYFPATHKQAVLAEQ